MRLNNAVNLVGSELATALVRHLSDGGDGMSFCEEHIPELSAESVEEFCRELEEVLGLENEKVRLKTQKKLENRVRYQPEAVLQWTNAKAGAALQRWKGEVDLKSPGLLKLATASRFEESLEEVQQFSIQNKTGRGVPGDAWARIENGDVAVSGGRVGWLKSSRAWEWLKQMFPKRIDARGYNHSLTAPLLPGGFWKGPVQFRTITTYTVENGEKVVIGAETDGCGRIHPCHELYSQLSRPGGPCTIQVRFINENGTFAKGILVPDERAVDESGAPAIWFDWNQVKGARKDGAKKAAKTGRITHASGYIGVLQAWDRPRKLKWSFEQLQMFARNEETEAIATRWIEAAFKKLEAMGASGLAASVAKNNVDVASALVLIAKMRESGIDIIPSDVPFIAAAMNAKLAKKLYFFGQGAGMASRQVVVAIDAGVELGTVVAPWFRTGEQVVLHRFPTLLPQGMVQLTVAAPLDHHLVQGKTVRETVFMHPSDITGRMQGDSDGDIVGITNNPDAISLMSHLMWDGKIRAVEPAGVKDETLLDSEEGLSYLNSDPRGNVGGMCLHQARLFAVGDIDGAIACAYPYQEAVDQAKRVVNHVDVWAAGNPAAWIQRGDGTWAVEKKIGVLERRKFESRTKGFVMARLGEFGYAEKNKEGRWTMTKDPLTWRFKEKRVQPSELEVFASFNDEGISLVEFSFLSAAKRWLSAKSVFALDEERSIDLSAIAGAIHQMTAGEFEPIRADWLTYRDGIRRACGLRDAVSEMRELYESLKARPESEEEELDEEKSTEKSMDFEAQMSAIMQRLRGKLSTMSAQQLEFAWFMEITHSMDQGNDKDGYGSLNNAFRAVAWAGSPLMESLGLQEQESCDFLSQEEVTSLTDIFVASDCPSEALAKFTLSATGHQQHVGEQGEMVAFHECEACMDRLTGAFVTKMRAQRKTVENRFWAKFIVKVNHKP